MKWNVVTLFFIALFGLSACATNTYRAELSAVESLPEKIRLSDKGGYIRQYVGDDQYQISFYSDNKYSSAITAAEYTLLGAAETTLSNHKAYFKIINANKSGTQLNVLMSDKARKEELNILGMRSGKVFSAREVQTGIRNRKSHGFD
ncbi:MAG: hypothetical protein OQL20_04180 [Sedimenticola sp.]|nr:hypothetical protein [Sedimenticola sp.]